jgi:hypothetical protein
MICSTVLTAFNDNAAITYLASLVPGLPDVFQIRRDGRSCYWQRTNFNRELTKSGRPNDPRLALWRGPESSLYTFSSELSYRR